VVSGVGFLGAGVIWPPMRHCNSRFERPTRSSRKRYRSPLRDAETLPPLSPLARVLGGGIDPKFPRLRRETPEFPPQKPALGANLRTSRHFLPRETREGPSLSSRSSQPSSKIPDVPDFLLIGTVGVAALLAGSSG
jgi:hypothetical protein